MVDGQIETLLTIHADALNQGEEWDEQLLAQYEKDSTDLLFLFRLAEALQVALRPLAAPADLAMFKGEREPKHWAEKEENRRLFWVIGGVASVVAGTAGVILWTRGRNRGDISTAV